MSVQCSKGWARRCSSAKSRRCRCACGGINHGSRRMRQEELFMTNFMVFEPEEGKDYRPSTEIAAHTDDMAEESHGIL